MGEGRRRSYWFGIDKIGVLIARTLLFTWVRTRVLPESVEELGLDPHKPVCYVLEGRFLSSLLVLERESKELGLPSPLAPIHPSLPQENHSLFSLHSSRDWIFLGHERARPTRRLERLVQAVWSDVVDDVQIVPVRVFWGRAPDTEQRFLKIVLSQRWAPSGALRRFFAIVLHGRNTLVQFSRPFLLRRIHRENPSLTVDDAVHKIERILRIHFRRVFTAAVGPDLSHRRILVDSILKSRRTQRAVGREAQIDGIRTDQAEARAQSYLEEIAADYSYTVIRVMELLLGWLWNRLYSGIEIHHVESLRRVAPGNEVVYLPCHRSHFDYLLLSYVVHQQGFVPPHIAAGINLNLPIVGSILRRCGAFFIRRSFKGEVLYSEMFSQYLDRILTQGVSLEYFIEAGRSRTGRLLRPRPGMLAMTVESFVANPVRPLVFVPIYIGYEKIFEGQSYIGELSGKPKEKESLLGLLRSLRVLKERFGRVHVSFGEPLFLDRLLNRQQPDWRSAVAGEDGLHAWLPPFVEGLGTEVMKRINEAANANPVNLLALTLLSTPRHALGEGDLASRLDLYVLLARKLPISNRFTITELSGAEIITYCESLGICQRRQQALGDIVYLPERDAALLAYHRNNILHLYAMTSLVAACFSNSKRLFPSRIQNFVALAYPFVDAELFLPVARTEVSVAIKQSIKVLVELGLLRRLDSGEIASPIGSTHAWMQLASLGQAVLPTLERFHIAIAVLSARGSGALTQRQLESQCQLLAQRLSIVYGFDSPEFFDKALFQNFITLLRRHGVVHDDNEGRLCFRHNLARASEDAELVLSPSVLHTIDRMVRKHLPLA